MERIEFGSKVRDTITGFEGIVRSYNEWDNGCVKYAVQGRVKDNGKSPEFEWIDAQQLEILEPAPKKEAKLTGGPMPTERQSNMPRG